MMPDDINTVAVIGSGTMGPGIADEFARSGRKALLVDLDVDRLAVGFRSIGAAHKILKGAGLLSEEEGTAALGRIRCTTSLSEAASNADLVIEAVSEDLPLKQEVLRSVDGFASSEALLATNTSGLSITAIASATSRPERVCGMHFWNPPYVVPLVEIIHGEQTAEETASLLSDLCSAIGKQPIRVRKDVPGFVANRLQFAVLREALHLLEEGVASAEDIDTAMRAGPGFRYGVIGPLQTADLGGLDVFMAISEYLFAQLSDAKGPSQGFKDLIGQGRSGVKSGQGFYDYADGAGARLVEERDRVLLAIRSLLENRGTT